MTSKILAPPGFSPRGADAGTVLEKFNLITAGLLSPAARTSVIACVFGLDAAPSCNDLTQALTASSDSAG